MSTETPIYEDSTSTHLEFSEGIDKCRIYFGDVLVYAGLYSEVSARSTVLFGEAFIFNGGTALEFWQAVRLIFRKNQVGLKWTQTNYESPFPEDSENLWFGHISLADFRAYPETSVRTFTAQDGTFSLDGHKREAIFDEAIEKLEAVNGGAIATPRVNLTHALLCAVREYSRCHDGLNGLGGLGLEEATKLARDINAQERITENSVAVLSYRLTAQAITANKFA